MEDKIKVGQCLYMIGDKDTIETYVVERVGKKYFYLNRIPDLPFDLTTLKYTNKDYSQYSKKLYRTSTEAQEVIEKDNLQRSITSYFYNFGVRKLSLEQMRDIDKIINPKL